MIRTFAIVMFTGMLTAGFAAASVDNHRSTEKFTEKIELDKDSIPESLVSEDPLLSPEAFYQRRLDSLQRAISLPYNEYVQHYIDIYLERGVHIGKMLGLSEYYFPIFEKALRETGLPDELKFLTVIESALNPHAVSRSGAVGPWQFMYPTAKGYGLHMDSYVDERKDPVKASFAAAKYFQDAYGRIGDWLLTIAAFNCGAGAVTRAIARSGGVADFWKVRPFLPRETQNYVPAFIATVYVMNYYKQHGIQSVPAALNTATDIIPVNRRISLSSIAKAANLDLDKLLLLNPSYKKRIINGSAAAPQALVLPEAGNYFYASLYDVLNGPDQNPGLSYASAGNVPRAVKSTYHKVRPGQTLSHIANQHDVEVQDLKVWNHLKSTRIVPGQTLRVSAIPKAMNTSKSAYQTYIVKAGDTLSEIAEKFKGATVSRIKAMNNLNKSVINPGMKLIISVL